MLDFLTGSSIRIMKSSHGVLNKNSTGLT